MRSKNTHTESKLLKHSFNTMFEMLLGLSVREIEKRSVINMTRLDGLNSP